MLKSGLGKGLAVLAALLLSFILWTFPWSFFWGGFSYGGTPFIREKFEGSDYWERVTGYGFGRHLKSHQGKVYYVTLLPQHGNIFVYQIDQARVDAAAPEYFRDFILFLGLAYDDPKTDSAFIEHILKILLQRETFPQPFYDWWETEKQSYTPDKAAIQKFLAFLEADFRNPDGQHNHFSSLFPGGGTMRRQFSPYMDQWIANWRPPGWRAKIQKQVWGWLD